MTKTGNSQTDKSREHRMETVLLDVNRDHGVYVRHQKYPLSSALQHNDANNQGHGE